MLNPLFNPLPRSIYVLPLTCMPLMKCTSPHLSLPREAVRQSCRPPGSTHLLSHQHMPPNLAPVPLQVASGQGAPDSDVCIVDVENHNALLPGDD